VVAAIGLGLGFVRRAPRPARMVRFEIATPEGLTTVDVPRVSPDGPVAFLKPNRSSLLTGV
jgi:hypothetical protein